MGSTFRMTEVVEFAMEIPALNISFENWSAPLSGYDRQPFGHLVLEGKFTRYRNKDVFRKFYLNRKYVDSYGNVYLLTGREKAPLWRRLIPFCYLSYYQFEDLSQHLAYDEVQQMVLKRLQEMNFPETMQEMIQLVKLAKNYQELYNILAGNIV